MELKTEHPGVSLKERGAKLRELAEKINLKNPDQFPDADIDYSVPFFRCRRELRQRIAQGRNDIVVLVQLKGEGLKLETFLGRRLPARIYGDTWAPIMGKIEERDLKHEFAKLPKIRFGEFIRLVPMLREEHEEKATAQLLAPAGILAKPYVDQETGRIIHVAVKFYPITSVRWERDPTIITERDYEHSETRWFPLTKLPFNQMADGTKKAMKNALTAIAEIQT